MAIGKIELIPRPVEKADIDWLVGSALQNSLVAGESTCLNLYIDQTYLATFYLAQTDLTQCTNTSSALFDWRGTSVKWLRYKPVFRLLQRTLEPLNIETLLYILPTNHRMRRSSIVQNLMGQEVPGLGIVIAVSLEKPAILKARKGNQDGISIGSPPGRRHPSHRPNGREEGQENEVSGTGTADKRVGAWSWFNEMERWFQGLRRLYRR